MDSNAIKDFDEILAASKPGDVIRLGAGLHTTVARTAYEVEGESGQVLKPGVHVLGSMEGKTVIMNTRTNPTTSINVITGTTDNALQDLEICGGAQGRDADLRVKINLAYLHGDNNVIHRVRGCQQYGTLNGMKESFGLAANGKNSGISNSVIDDPHGTYITAIQANKIANCEVRFPRNVWDNVSRFLAAYNVGDTEEGEVKNCTSWNAVYHVYRDWLKTVKLTVTNTTAINCRSGLCIRVQPDPEKPADQQTSGGVTEINFVGNSIYLDPTAAQVDGVLIEHSVAGRDEVEVNQGFVNDVTIVGNLFTFAAGTILTKEAWGVNISSRMGKGKLSETFGVNRFKFEGNRTHPDLRYRNRGDIGDAGGHIITPIKWVN